MSQMLQKKNAKVTTLRKCISYTRASCRNKPRDLRVLCEPEQTLQRCAQRHKAKGVVQRPLFHEIQTTAEAEDPGGSLNRSGCSLDWAREDSRTEEPAAWKLNSWTFIHDQSVRRMAAACSRNAWSYASQTFPEKWRNVRRMRSWYCSKSFRRCGKWVTITKAFTFNHM